MAMAAWDRLRYIFQDNQHSLVVTLEQEFTNTNMEDFPNASSYYQRLKSLSDQLKNVRSPVSDSRLVLQMVAGLIEANKGVETLVRQMNPLPLFYQARSMLTLEEAGLSKKVATGSNSAMVTTSQKDFDDNPSHLENSNLNRGKKG
ncbi:uncharacterized protein LOC133806074 [Humulus lupulus]|uniref:uncharacterized protein LOC133806074 n=1 Tax=Humulus lupulus TaxID=3486 RepID=UPI002B404743|nr:uncharacterized protein LOC133806074 [Humulus lupulus]